MDTYTNCDTSTQCNSTQQWKGMNYWYTQHYESWNNYTEGLKPHIKRVHALWLHCYEILENAN